MGQLHEGTPLPWSRVRELSDHIRERGIKQFLETWKRNTGALEVGGRELTWGDELESMVVRFDDEKKLALLALGQDELIGVLKSAGANGGAMNGSHYGWCVFPLLSWYGSRPPPEFDPEYGSYMIETSPGQAYGPTLSSLLEIEPDLSHRRALIQAHLSPSEALLTLSSFPRLGAEGRWSEPQYEPGGPVLQSFWLPDAVVNAHVRYGALGQAVVGRRGRRVQVKVPVYRDVRTPWPFEDERQARELYAGDEEARKTFTPGYIHMDAIAFGAGCCCVQTTLQAPDLSAARTLYDALLPLAPVMLALSAASPAHRGWLADVDARWDVIREAVDDRTEEEMGLKLLPKSRYDSSSLYISSSPTNKPAYSDLPLPINERAYAMLREGGVDECMARHVAHLFVRDALVVLQESLEEADECDLRHFENILSTNWQTLRLKPAAPDGSTGWRIEFRACEAQLTDFENAALCIFVVLLSRSILHFDVELYVPLSRVDEGMRRAVRRDAVQGERFWWRKDVKVGANDRGCKGGEGSVYDECEEMTVDEIINGTDDTPGLIGLIHRYLQAVACPPDTFHQLQRYLALISRRASGELKTNARWMREFITSHPSYERDSRVGEEVCWALMRAIEELEGGRREEKGLIPPES
ncbi:gamma glutamylcysteine synthetase [Calocera cornea HHB12733]|uniref:Glutamate--cysteine ligase n=1 Tax=Calocera cornea HHB12733 TaxID=1353952 RepID=A0A165D6N7_9BASI|nr:gamma glutamylcysteine synthetase [Calocera cornea HHB12733]